jgi:phosphoglycerate dehydrogenase-like enzyme
MPIHPLDQIDSCRLPPQAVAAQTACKIGRPTTTEVRGLTMPQPNVLVTLTPSLFQQLFSPEAQSRLQAVAQLRFNEEDRNWSSAELAQHIGGYDAVITGWGTPTFTPEVMAAADRLRLIAHSAGSIKKMLPPHVFDSDVQVTHAAAAIAPAVAEMTMLLILLSLRQVHVQDRKLKAGVPWREAQYMGQELAGQRVGVVGAGYTGRCVIRLLVAWGAEVWVADPYLSAERVAQLGVTHVTLEELFANCPIVTMQAPPTDETFRMVKAHHLASLPDGAIFVNTAHTVDNDALLAELQSGRIQAALDVFDQEPLPADSPFLQLENVILTPHTAGASRQARLRQGTVIVEELERFLRSESLHYAVTGEMLATMA